MTAGSGNGSVGTGTQANDPKLDHSVLRSSIDISITGMKQALHALENGNKEIRNYMFHECNIIYECKICFNMFRSLANFVIHKRSYCEKRYCDVIHQTKPGDNDPYQDSEDVIEHSLSKVQHPCIKPSQTTVFVIPENPIETVFEEETWDINDYAPSLALLQEAGVLEEIEGSPLSDAIRAHKKRKGYQINSIAAKLKSKVDDAFDDSYYKSKSIRLEKMCQTKNAVFQTMSQDEHSPTMGHQYVELQKAQKLGTHFLGPDGKIIYPSLYDSWTGDNSNNQANSIVSASKSIDVLDKNATNKIKESSNSSPNAGERQLLCPRCSKEFSSVSNTYRHLVNVHGYSKVGAMRMRNKIIQQRPQKPIKNGLVSKPPTLKFDNSLPVRSRSSSDVSIAHFSKVDQKRAEECLKNKPKVRSPEKSMSREGDKIVEKNNLLQREEEGHSSTNQNLYINKLYVQVNNFDPEDQNKNDNEITFSAPSDQAQSSNEYVLHKEKSSRIEDITNLNDSPLVSSVLNQGREVFEKQETEYNPDSDYESHSPSSRTSRSSRTSNTAISSERTQIEKSMLSKDVGLHLNSATIRQSLQNKEYSLSNASSSSHRSSRSSSKENVLDSENDKTNLKINPSSPSNIKSTSQNHCLFSPTKFNGSSIINGSSELTDFIKISENKDSFRRNSRTSKRISEEASGNISRLALPSVPLEYAAGNAKRQNKKSHESSNTLQADSCNKNGKEKQLNSSLQEKVSTMSTEEETMNCKVEQPVQTSSIIETCGNNFRRGKEPLLKTVSTWNGQNHVRSSPRSPRLSPPTEDSKEAAHSMLSTIKARRAINGRTLFQDNSFIYPNSSIVRTVNLKSQNISSSLPLSVLGNNQTNTADLSMPPLFKKRKLT